MPDREPVNIKDIEEKHRKRLALDAFNLLTQILEDYETDVIPMVEKAQDTFDIKREGSFPLVVSKDLDRRRNRMIVTELIVYPDKVIRRQRVEHPVTGSSVITVLFDRMLNKIRRPYELSSFEISALVIGRVLSSNPLDEAPISQSPWGPMPSA